MPKLFNRALLWTDLHLGRKSNSQVHNNDCWQFTKWLCQIAKERECDTCIFLGDFHNNRNNVNILTLNHSQQCLELVAKTFQKTYLIPGNHDLFYKDNRLAYSVRWSSNIPGIEIINDITTINECVFVPWMVGDEYKELSKRHGQYMFGHMELPNFVMNAHIRMPDVGTIQLSHLGGVQQVFSGHFHKRQKQEHIWYIGNCFPLDFSDEGDDKRGVAILDWGSEPEFISWPDAPRFRVYDLSEIVMNPDKLMMPNSYVRANLDIDISYEEANYLREKFIADYQLREITLLPTKQDLFAEDLAPGEAKFDSVDQIVTSQITAIQSDAYDTNLILHIYNTL